MYRLILVKMKLFEIMTQDIKKVQGRVVVLKRKFKRIYRKYWNIAVPLLLGYVGITPVQYQTGKKVWKSKPLRKTRSRTKRLLKKYLKYIFTALLVYYFIENPADFQIMVMHFLGVLASMGNRVVEFIRQNLN